MKASDFCLFFDFILEKETGIDENGDSYNYAAYDTQGVFATRYVAKVNDLISCFDSCLPDYVDDSLEYHGFLFDDTKDKSYYEQALDWITENNFYPELKEVVSALVSGHLEDNLNKKG